MTSRASWPSLRRSSEPAGAGACGAHVSGAGGVAGCDASVMAASFTRTLALPSRAGPAKAEPARVSCRMPGPTSVPDPGGAAPPYTRPPHLRRRRSRPRPPGPPEPPAQSPRRKTTATSRSTRHPARPPVPLPRPPTNNGRRRLSFPACATPPRPRPPVLAAALPSLPLAFAAAARSQPARKVPFGGAPAFIFNRAACPISTCGTHRS